MLTRARVFSSAIGVAAVGAAIAGAATAVAAPAAPSPAQVVAAALDAGKGQTSVRWISTATVKGTKIAILTNAGRSMGSQVVTWTEGKTEALLSIGLVGNTVYLIGDGGGLYLEGFTAAASAREAGKWISVGPSSPVYGPTAAGLTVSTTIDLLNMEGPVTELAGTRLLGYRTLGFKGTSEPSEGQPAAPERIYVRSTGTPLPVEAIEDGTTTLFDDWGEPVNVSVPLGAVLIQSSWLRAR